MVPSVMCVLFLSRYGHVFLWDSGSSVGEIIGHSKPINSIDYRPARPFRVATGGEDRIACWFEGPPFRYKTAFHDHERFVNVVRFSPNGERLLTGGADGKVTRQLCIVCEVNLCVHLTQVMCIINVPYRYLTP